MIESNKRISAPIRSDKGVCATFEIGKIENG